jgi:hypothetical protein
MASDTASPPAKVQKTSQADSAAVPEKTQAMRRCPRCKQETLERKGGNLDDEVPDIHNQLIPAPQPPLRQHPLFNHCKPPVPPAYNKFSLFVAGSIEMGAAVQWQERLAQHLWDLPITICNPRRGHWDPNVDVKSKDKDFAEQVVWELEALHEATVICFFFDQDTLSPVTLLELGLWAHSKKIIVCCAEEYWRSGNVDLTCKRYKIPRVKSFKQLVPAIKEMLGRKGMKLDKNGDLIGGNERVVKDKKDVKAVEASDEDEWWLKYQNPAEEHVEPEDATDLKIEP